MASVRFETDWWRLQRMLVLVHSEKREREKRELISTRKRQLPFPALLLSHSIALQEQVLISDLKLFEFVLKIEPICFYTRDFAICGPCAWCPACSLLANRDSFLTLCFTSTSPPYIIHHNKYLGPSRSWHLLRFRVI